MKRTRPTASGRNGKHHDPAPPAYPRPQLERSGTWISLNGNWQFAIDEHAAWKRPEDFQSQTDILVPFAPETPRSGVHNTGFYNAVWYRRTFTPPPLQEGQRLLLNFGAVDYQCRVWVNDRLAVEHEGGYTPFSADITDLLRDGEQAITVQAVDDPHDLAKPRGKQDWKLDPHSIWYARTTGIWQTVWLEVVPRTWIARVRWTPELVRWEIGYEVWLDGCPPHPQDLSVRVRLTLGDRVLSDDTCAAVAGEVHRRVALSDPGIDDSRNEILWSPDSPRLIDALIELRTADGRVIDAVHSYTALRSVALHGNQFMLNGRPLQLRLVLDQGYWEESGLTAPSDDALRRDVELVKAMGFNGVRKHQKIEDPRYLHWADHLGLLVWEEMPSPYRFTPASVRRLNTEWHAVIERDVSHPCIVAWVPFNESWGVPDLPESPAQRHWVRAIYNLTRTLDPTRPCIGNDGWEAVATDIITIHDYDASPDRMRKRYDVADDDVKHLLQRERPGYRALLLDTSAYQGQPLMLTEFGGIAFARDAGATWGYSRAESAPVFAARYAALLDAVRGLNVFAGFCYTQFTDAYQEANGLLYMDRTPKFPIEEIAIATRGPRNDGDRQLEAGWRKRLMQHQRAGKPRR
jgi:hypothetical protein